MEAEDVGVASAVGVDRFIGIVMDDMDMDELEGCSMFWMILVRIIWEKVWIWELSGDLVTAWWFCEIMLILPWHSGEFWSYLLVPSMRHGKCRGRKNSTNHVKVHLVFLLGRRGLFLWIVENRERYSEGYSRAVLMAVDRIWWMLVWAYTRYFEHPFIFPSPIRRALSILHHLLHTYVSRRGASIMCT